MYWIFALAAAFFEQYLTAICLFQCFHKLSRSSSRSWESQRAKHGFATTDSAKVKLPYEPHESRARKTKTSWDMPTVPRKYWGHSSWLLGASTHLVYNNHNCMVITYLPSSQQSWKWTGALEGYHPLETPSPLP